MSKIAFEADRASRNVTRFLFVLQGMGLLLVICLRLLNLSVPALLVSILTLILFTASLLWLYLRYRSMPLVRQKIELESLYRRFEKSVHSEGNVIQAAILERERLVQAEQEEIDIAKSTLEKDRIGQKYQALQEKNGSAESRARASKELLQYELVRFKPRLEQLAHLTFPHYLRGALSAHQLTAGLLALALIGMQMVSSVSAARSLIVAHPPATSTTAQLALVASPVAPTDIPTLAFTATADEIAVPTAASTETAVSISPPTVQPTLPSGLALCIPQNTVRETGLVVGVVDGDTIDVQIGDQVQRVRYIGMDTPEQDEALYQEAAAYNQSMVLSKTVTLVKDTSDVDSFNRLLRYVVVENTFVNQALVELGYAEASAYAPDTACVSAFEAAQVQAQTAKAGLWLSTPVAFIAPVTGGEPTANCDPSYPGVCIPLAPPDLDCGDIAFDRFQVVPPDSHGFDGDQDGVGCE
jgi:micrococcal nuclease